MYQYNPLTSQLRLVDDKTKKSSGYVFHIRPKEKDGTIPHFHIYTENENKKSKKYFECCIRFDKCDYWNHEKYHSPLNSKDKIKVVNFLKSKIKSNYTIWNYLKDQWNLAYPNHKVTNRMPDYSKLDTSGT